MRSRLLRLSVFLFMLSAFAIASAQQVYTFTPAGALQNIGPTQLQVNAAYTGTNLDGDVTVIGGIQYWIVPVTGNYEIEASGGQGYGSFGGRGARMTGEFALTAGDTLKILVGQYAGPYLNWPATTYNHQFGGGGGSFVTYPNNTPLIVAGGGGGNHGAAYVATCDGQITTSGAAGANGSTTSLGGTNGSGGLAASSADGGGGLLTNGGGLAGGVAFVNGGNGGADEGIGGFGGGGGTSSWNNYRGGGGGGYSGGGAGNNGGSCCPAGGGGGSFNAGANQINLAGVQIGDGSVIVRLLSLPPNDGGAAAILGFVPPVCTGNYPVEVVIKNFGSNQINPITIQWSVNGFPQPDSIITTVIDTIGGAGPDSINVVLGNLNITAATNIKVWTTLPNNVADPSAGNDTIEINIAAPVIVSGNLDMDVSCNGGNDGGATSSATGGTPAYSYLWSNGATTASITGVSAGTYTVTLTDAAGCTDNITVTVSEPTALTAMDSTMHVTCNGDGDGAIDLSPAGGTPGYSILWTAGDTTWMLTGLNGGSYAYTITDLNGCTLPGSVTVNEPAAIALSVAETDETAPGNGAVDLTVTGGTGPWTYVWSNGATTEDISGLVAGTYTVTVTDANGCVETISAVVSLMIGNQAPLAAFDFSIAPNPTNGLCNLRISNSTGEETIEVTDLLGKRMLWIENANALTQIHLPVSSGIFLVKVTSGESSVTKRLVVTQ